jgi:predicted patatin/cPLA2 family phospholipase
MNEIHVYAYSSPEEHNGVVTIQNLIERRIFKITPDKTINENNIGEYLKKIENKIKNGKHTGNE